MTFDFVAVAGMGTTVHSREGGSPGRGFFDLAELREASELTPCFGTSYQQSQ